MYAAMLSLVRGKAWGRTAFSGEISLHGAVSGVGEIGRKAQWAYKSGVERLFVAAENMEELRPLAEILPLKIIPVRHVSELNAYLEEYKDDAAYI